MESVFSGPERRSARVPAKLSIRLLLNGEDASPGRSAHTVDLSDRGLRIRTGSSLSAGATIRIDSWGEDGRPMPSRVVWVQQSATGEFVAGVEFLAAGQA
jgi:PilZ domain